VIVHPGGLIGLPAGVPSATYDLGWWRDLLVVVALAAAACEARARRGAAVGFALLFAVLAIGFWVAALARPHGVLVDPATTLWAADVSVAGWAGGSERFLAGEPRVGGLGAWLASRVRPDLVLLLPTLLPLFVVPAAALAVAFLWRHRDAGLAAILWVGGGTGALDALRGTGFLTGLWTRPRAAMLWVATAAAVLVVGRLRLPVPARVALGVLVVAGGALLGPRGLALGPGDALLALTFDHHLWLLVGLAGLVRSRDPAACALYAGGSLVVLMRALGGPGDAWAGASLARLGLVLGATAWLAEVGPTLAPARLPERTFRLSARLGLVAERLPSAAIVALVLAGGFLAWWDPPRTDPVAKESLEPVPEALLEAMEWMRARTPRESSVLAAEDYAAAVSVLGGRRVLRAPGLLTAPDEERRLRLQRAALAGHPPAALLQRYGLRYVFIAPGQFREDGLAQPEDLEGRGAFRLAYSNAKGMRVYEIVTGASDADGRAAAIK
jgi:hypothetical protein